MRQYPKPCMGGFCNPAIRDVCPHYNSADAATDPHPFERMCDRGDDGGDVFVRRVVPAGQWERKHAGLLARATVFGGLEAVA